MEDRCTPSTLTATIPPDPILIPPDPIVPPELQTALASPGAAQRSDAAHHALTQNVARLIPTDPDIIPPDPIVPPELQTALASPGAGKSV